MQSKPRSTRTIRQIAVGSLLAALLIGATAGTALAETSTVQPVAHSAQVVFDVPAAPAASSR